MSAMIQGLLLSIMTHATMHGCMTEKARWIFIFLSANGHKYPGFFIPYWKLFQAHGGFPLEIRRALCFLLITYVLDLRKPVPPSIVVRSAEGMQLSGIQRRFRWTGRDRQSS